MTIPGDEEERWWVEVAGNNQTRVDDLRPALLAFVAWHLLRQGLDAYELGEASNMIEVPHFPFFMVATVGTGILSVVFLYQAVQGILEPVSGDDR